MNDAKSTPGPWHVDLHTNVMAHGGMVAFPGIAAGFDQKANARLIAAAPELLAALQGLDDAYCRAGTPLSKTERHEDRMRLIAARAAIAKATGSTS